MRRRDRERERDQPADAGGKHDKREREEEREGAGGVHGTLGEVAPQSTNNKCCVLGEGRNGCRCPDKEGERGKEGGGLGAGMIIDHSVGNGRPFSTGKSILLMVIIIGRILGFNLFLY